MPKHHSKRWIEGQQRPSWGYPSTRSRCFGRPQMSAHPCDCAACTNGHVQAESRVGVGGAQRRVGDGPR